MRDALLPWRTAQGSVELGLEICAVSLGEKRLATAPRWPKAFYLGAPCEPLPASYGRGRGSESWPGHGVSNPNQFLWTNWSALGTPKGSCRRRLGDPTRSRRQTIAIGVDRTDGHTGIAQRRYCEYEPRNAVVGQLLKAQRLEEIDAVVPEQQSMHWRCIPG
jgi:hypothetical protein